MADQRNHRHMVELGVVKAIQQMNRARTGRRVAKAHLARELGVRRRHKGRHLLVADLDIFHKILGLLQGYIQAADAVARITVDPLEPPFRQSPPNEFADIPAHFCCPVREPREILARRACDAPFDERWKAGNVASLTPKSGGRLPALKERSAGPREAERAHRLASPAVASLPPNAERLLPHPATFSHYRHPGGNGPPRSSEVE